MKTTIQAVALLTILALSSCGKGDISALVGHWVNQAGTEVAEVTSEGEVKSYNRTTNGTVIGEVSEDGKGKYKISIDSKYKESLLKGLSGEQLKQAEEAINDTETSVVLKSSDEIEVTQTRGENSGSTTYTRVKADAIKNTIAVARGEAQQGFTTDQLPEQPGFGFQN